MSTVILLREAIAAVKAGQRHYARELFIELVEREPTNELAWIWLSGLLESREDQIKALENSLAIESGGSDLETRIDPLSRPEFGPEQTKFRQAIKLLDRGNRSQSHVLLQEVVDSNRNHEQAWVALSDLVESDEEQIIALEHVIRINPNNFKAREKLAKVQHLLYQNNLVLGRAYQRQGEFKKAVESYKLAERFASTGAFRAAAHQRWVMIESQGQDEKETNPTMTLLRLAVGPPLLFGLLVLIQGGLNPMQILPLLCLGGAFVTLGSLLWVASTRTPHHPIWLSIWGQKGLTDVKRRTRLRNLGIIMVLVPFVIWIISAFQRLGYSLPTF